MLISEIGTSKLAQQKVTEKPEAQVVAAARRGDPESFGRLYEHYYGPMVAVAFSVLADRHLAEDAAQEAFVRACGNLGKLKQPEKFASWLAAICRNVAYQALRNRKKLSFVEDPPVHTTENQGDETIEVIRKALWQLPAPDRQILVLRYFNDLSYEKIAQVLDTTVSAIHGRLFRARKKIAHKLKRMGFSGEQS
jgi:RNA polymerase sigma-70 factor (ECF subfamily)